MQKRFRAPRLRQLPMLSMHLPNYCTFGCEKPMPEKYHIETKPVPPRRPRIGKFGVVDWREDCARCHNCVKKACVYDRYRQEAEYIRTLESVDALFFECMGCFSCVQNCTKGLLRLAVNPVFEGLGNSYWTPDIIHTTWTQAERRRFPSPAPATAARSAGRASTACGRTCPKSFGPRATAFTAASTSAPQWTSAASPRTCPLTRSRPTSISRACRSRCR